MRIIDGTPVYKAEKYETLRDLVVTSCEKHSTYDAFIFRRNPKMSEIHKTYFEFGEDVKSLGTYILNSKYKGDKLAVVGENSYEWLVSYLAILSTDSVGVPLDKLLPEDELINLLERSESKVIFYDPKHHDMMVSIVEKIKAGTANLVVEKFVCKYAEGVKGGFPEGNEMFVDINTWIAEGKKLRDAGDNSFLTTPINREEARIILFTSGTTSISKGVLLSHKNICANVFSISSTLDVHKGDRAFSVLPLHHTYENTIDMFMLSVGCCLCESDGLRYIVKNLQEWHPDVCISVPLLFENIYSKIEDGIKESGKQKLIDIMIPVTKFLCKIGIDLRRAVFKDVLDKLGGNLRLVVIGAAAIDVKYIDAFTNFGIDFFQGYGLTEASPVISVTSTDCNIHGSVGRPMYGIQAAVDTEDTGKNAVGEILTKSDCVMLGYYKNEEATKEVLDPDGWLHTGDMGFIDKTGSIHITGRVKSMIVLTSGKKAFPEEIESLVAEIKGVSEVFVWGNKNGRDGIDICAKLLIDRARIGEALGVPGVPTDEEVAAYLNDAMYEVNHKMPAYKIVRNFVFSETDMIKTTTLKIRRPMEQKSIEDLLEKNSTTMRAMNGTNIDRLAR